MPQLAHAADEGPLDERFQQLSRWTYLMMQVHWADIFLGFAEGATPLCADSQLQDVLIHHGHLANFISNYSKCFASAGRGRTKLEASDVFGDDEHLREIHERIMHLRNKHIAHNDASGLDDVLINVTELEDAFVASHSMGIALPLNEYPYYRKALRTLELYIVDGSERHRESLERSLGKPIQIKLKWTHKPEPGSS
ncbi:MAG: hypothetical protein AAF546_15415 [Verrucomicrobiota bacterium]